jgi:uncharacterized membrane protein
LFLILTGGFVLSLKRPYEISQINLFVILLWLLIAIYFLASKFYPARFPLENLLPLKATDFLIKTFEDFKPERLWKLGLILSSIFAITFIVCSIFKYYSFNAYMWDLGFFDNLLWNTSMGRFYKVGAVFKPYESVLGDHLHPIILVFVPFYKIYPTPVWLLLFQPIIVAIGGLGVFRLAYAVLKDKSLSFLFFLAYLMYLPLRRGILFDFHESSFFPAIYIWMFVYYFEGKYKKALIFFILSFAIKETAALYNSVLLLSILFSRRSKRHKITAAILSGICLGIFFFETQVLIPGFRGGTEYEYYQKYESIGRTPLGIVEFLFTDPASFLLHLFQQDKIIFTFKVLAPLACLSLFTLRGCLIVAIPLLVLILPDDPKKYDTQFRYHYGLDLAPFVFLSAILGLKNLQVLFPIVKKRFVFFLILWLSLALYDKSEIMRIRSFIPTKEDLQLHEFLRNIPKEKTIRSVTNCVPHFSERNNFQEATWRQPRPENEDYYVVPTLFVNKPEVVIGLKENQYRLLKEIGKVSIFVKK